MDVKTILIAIATGLVGTVWISVVVLSIATGSISEALLTMASTITGAALVMLREAFGFEFGSSRSSQSKDATIAKAVEK